MKSTKKLTLVIVVIVALIAAVIGILFAIGVLGDKKEEYRVVAVKSYEGDIKLERNSKEQELFQDMNIKTKDRISIGEDSKMLLLADSDKHILVEENSCFSIITSGDEDKGKISISLEYGTVHIDIENKLNDDSVFEVDTPNANISVKGTIFEVSYNEKTGETLLTVEDGCVKVVNDILSKLINEGENVVITDEEILNVDEIRDADKEYDTELENNEDNKDNENAETPMDLSVLEDGVDEQDWPYILKNGADITALEYCLGIMTKCKIDGHENYVAEALIDLDANVYYKDLFGYIANFQKSDLQWYAAYNIPKLNKLYQLMNNQIISEADFLEDTDTQGNEIYLNLNLPEEYCVDGIKAKPVADYISTNCYYSCPMNVAINNVDASDVNKIVVEYTYVLNDRDGNIIYEKSPFVAYLETVEDGRYVITSIDKN